MNIEDSTHFRAALVEQCMDALGSGARRLLFWGYNADCIAVLGRLFELGMPPEFLVGIVDSNPAVLGTRLGSHAVASHEAIGGSELDTLVVTVDSSKEEALASFGRVHPGTPRVIIAGLGHLEFSDPGVEEILLTCLVKSYATGYPNSLIHLYQTIQYLAAKGLRGDVAEFGICKGGTVVFLKKALERFGLTESTVYGFDIFEGFPGKKSALDLYRHPKCEFKDYETVVNYCERFGIKVVKGDICETYKVLEGRPLILSFFDTDNYSPARAALELCSEQTVPGGAIFFDHFTTVPDYLYTIGERMAAKEVLLPGKFFNPHGTGMFIKL